MVSIRDGIKKDLPALLELIKELAIYEHALSEVDNTLEKMEVDGFGEHPVFDFLVASEEDRVVGASVFYFRYSTWKGRRIYLEDLIVNEDFRGQGIGKMLLDATVEKARQRNCTGLMWQVLDWNEPAINFYKKYKVRFDEGWLNCHLDF
ncbi:MAG: GNAT family N-acetyltransferase [Bacteroidota bacterium]